MVSDDLYSIGSVLDSRCKSFTLLDAGHGTVMHLALRYKLGPYFWGSVDLCNNSPFVRGLRTRGL